MMFLANVAMAQIAWGDYSQSYNDGNNLTILVAIRSDNNSFWSHNGSSPLFKSYVNDSIRLAYGNNLISRTTFDSSKVHFFVKGVNRVNAYLFKFRVLQFPSGKEIIPWTTISGFSDPVVEKDSGLPTMAYIGGYRAEPGNMLVVEVKENKSSQQVTGALVAWEHLRPEFGGVYTNANLGIFLKRLQYPWSVSGTAVEPVKLQAEDNNLVVYLNAEIYHKHQLQYQLSRDGVIVIPWKENEFDNSFVWVKEKQPGAYLLSIRYSVQPANVSEYGFEIEPAWYQSFIFRLALVVVSLAFLGGIILMLLYVRQRRSIQRNLIQKNKLQLELKGIYAQWNPHFVFNALGSIQGLINKQDVTGANQYLSDFARLMRESLNRGQRDSVSLSEECSVLETYLKLEQLRFGFRYEINIDPAIDAYTTDVPAQLLQPLVENGIKHGISVLQSHGVISLHFVRRGDDLMATITDNGRGFDFNSTALGVGLKMTFDRINLLNQLRPFQSIEMTMNRHKDSGMSVIVKFNHWFL